MLGQDLSETRFHLRSGTDALGRIYAIAGVRLGSETALVERFDPSNPSAGWVFGPSLNQKRQLATASTDGDGSIYALGGWGPGFLSSVEVYDPVGDKWLVHSNMNRSINGIASAFDSVGRLYAVGGHDLSVAKSGVERVPEPTVLALLSVGVSMVLVRRSKRC